MNKRQPPPPPLLPFSQQQTQQTMRAAAAGGSDSGLESSLLLSSSGAASSAAAGLPFPLPPVQVLPLHVHLQQQQQHPLHVHLQQQQQHPLMVLIPPPPPPQPQPIRRKRLLPRIVALDGGAVAGGHTTDSYVHAVAPPTPVTRSTSGVSSASSARSVTDAVSTMTVTGGSSSRSEVNAPGPVDAKTSAAKQKPPKKRIRIKTDRRREQCRVNQARYRSKQRGEAVVLEERVEELRAEVSELERQRYVRNHVSNSSSNEASMRVVREYFRYFRHGLSQKEVPANQPSQTVPEAQQIAFLRSVMTPDLQFGDVRGVDALIEQWRLYSRFYGDLSFTLESVFSVQNASLDDRVSYTIHTAATLIATITQTTIERVFPHLETLERLKSKLVGKRVVLPCTLEFAFDEFHKVQLLTCSAEYAASLQVVLGNVRDVAVVLENAWIQHDFFLVSEGERIA